MKTKVIETSFLPECRIVAITLFGLVFTRHRDRLDKYMLNHELIHCRQQLEWLYVPFFALYLAEWLWYMARYRNWDRAYMAISFEREAYANDHNLEYLKHRKIYQNYRKKEN
ncbi:MAG: hypothetical protein HUJ98_11555 [Bacteroidaceae bacterium]|nr:hypothetical protein [Bacteroidaceae bacterium]